MDNITHALAGLLLADGAVSMVQRRIGRNVPSTAEGPTLSRFRRAAVVLGITAAEFPDADLVYSGPMVAMGKLGYLLHHRGHTHTVVWALVSALALWAAARWWWQRGLSGHERADATAAIVAREGSRAFLLLAVVGTLSHLLLDFTNSYGVHPFWPFDNRWFYGDSVFIVEPWLMVVAIPPLLWGPRRTTGRVLLSLVLVLILAASWWLGEVGRNMAAVLTVVAALWLAVQWAIPAAHRAWSGIAAWACVSVFFFFASGQARGQLRAVIADGSLHDVVLTPGAADPRCFAALVVTTTATEYRISSATVAPFPTARTASACTAARGGGNARTALGVLSNGSSIESARLAPVAWFANTATVSWGDTWAVSRAEFATLVRTRCEFAAALRFMRTPAWTTGRDQSLQLYDVRFGAGGGFAALDVPPPSALCALRGKWIPPWVPPTRGVTHDVTH